jgi:hypothetical protein
MPSQKYLFLHRSAPSQQQGSSREQPSPAQMQEILYTTHRFASFDR